MIKIRAKTIPHDKQRYDTCGDYFQDGETLQFRVSDMGNWKMEYLVLIHELVEYALVKAKGIHIEEIDEFDMDFERKRKLRPAEFSEPGEDPHAPYHMEHRIADVVERLLATELGVSWTDYERKVLGL